MLRGDSPPLEIESHRRFNGKLQALSGFDRLFA